MQYLALQILELLDEIYKIDEQDRQLRLALVAANRVDPEDAFPHLQFAIADDNADLPDEADAEGNPIAARYDFSNATYDPKAVEEEIKEMLARAAGGAATFDEY